MKNKMKDALASGKTQIGTWITTASPDVTELIAGAGFDFLVFDMEHAPLSIETVQNLLQVSKGSGTTPLVRVAWNDQVMIKLALDVGAEGLVIPQVNTKEDAETAVRAMRYPPAGTRGIGPRRASDYYRSFKEYISSADKELLVALQIEHIDAVKNVDQIVGVQGVDVLFIGPADLSASMGLLGKHDHQSVQSAIGEVFKAALKRNVTIGIHTFDSDDAMKKMAMGARMVMISTDVGLLTKGCKDTLSGITRR